MPVAEVSSDRQPLRTEIDEGVAVVVIDDPARRNAFDLALCAEIEQAFDDLEARTDVGAIVVTGAPPAFCAGADLSHLAGSEREGLQAIYAGFLRVARCPKPTIAAVNGAAVGAGVNLALACDVRIAARSATFDARFLQLGMHPGGGHTWMLQQVIGSQGVSALTLFGDVLDGEEAERCGLAWRCVADEDLPETACAMARRVAAAPSELVHRVKRTISDMRTIDRHVVAIERELAEQVWSVQQPAFQARLAALRSSISSKA